MDTIYIKKQTKPGDPSVVRFIVPAVGIKAVEGTRLIPHPYGTETTTFETLEETIEQVHRAGYDAEYDSQRYPLPVRHNRQPTKKQISRKQGSHWLGLIHDAIPSLQHQLKDNAPSVVASAAWALGELRDESAIAGLIHAFSNEDATVRKHAAEALAKIGRPALGAIQLALKDKHWLVRHSALQAMIDMVHLQVDLVPELIPNALQLLKDESWLVRSQAATMFGEAAKVFHALEDKST